MIFASDPAKQLLNAPHQAQEPKESDQSCQAEHLSALGHMGPIWPHMATYIGNGNISSGNLRRTILKSCATCASTWVRFDYLAFLEIPDGSLLS